MTEHVAALLGAYCDGEMSGHRVREVQAHLAECQRCRAELAEVRSLSLLLRESAGAPTRTPPERFVAQVTLRLPSRAPMARKRQALELGWWLVPLVLLCAWSFLQAVLIVSDLALLALSMGLGGEMAAKLPLAPRSAGGLAGLTGAGIADVVAGLPRLLSYVGPRGWVVIVHFIVLVVFALLYWSWLASWQVRLRRPV